MTQPRGSAPASESAASTLHWLAHILLILLVLLVWRGRGHGESPLFNPSAQEPPVAVRGNLTAGERATIDVYQRVAPSVVHITSLARMRDRISLDESDIPQGNGSGFVWDDDGYIVTNYHVVAGADRFRVTLSNWTQQFEARPVGSAPDHDLAVLKVDVPSGALRPVAIGTSQGLLQGQSVLAIGSPFELDQTLTTGVISGLGREIPALTGRPIQGAIQTDAAINPGNSGGPLLDSSGLVIGVTAQIRSPTGANAGVGFAIPIDTVRRIVPQLIRSGQVERIGIGINLWPDQVTARLGIPGIMIRDVVPDGPASRAGLRGTRRDRSGTVIPGDVIFGADGRSVTSALDLYRAIDQRQVGQSLKVKVRRDGEQLSLDVPLAVLEP